MTDIFADKHRADTERAQKEAIKQQSLAHTKAIGELAKRKETQAKQNPNDDIGYRPRPKFFEPGV